VPAAALLQCHYCKLPDEPASPDISDETRSIRHPDAVERTVGRTAVERSALITDSITFASLRAQALINEAAKKAHYDDAFSDRIRDNRAGFGED
jgi:hypothetical protein